MDFGIGFLSNNVMLPILDFFYGMVPSYGLAIIALTLVIRFALFPLTANQIRSMRRMKIANPEMQRRIKEVQGKYKDDPAKQQEEMARVNAANFKEFGNPLSGCLPALLQMPILFALFATLRGSPFADLNYSVNFQIFPAEQQTEVQPQTFVTSPQNVFFADKVHYPVQAIVPSGTNILVGEKTKINLQTAQGDSFETINAKFPDIDLTPIWHLTKGETLAEVSADGTVKALSPGEITVQATVPGLAANKGFLFIQALGKVGATNPDGSINWDILIMILGFGLSLYVNQNISGNQSAGGENSQQEAMNKFMPVIFSGMFLFFPLPAGVLMYMLLANIFQTIQSFIVNREPLPENLQKLVEATAALTPSLQLETGTTGVNTTQDKNQPKSTSAKPKDAKDTGKNSDKGNKKDDEGGRTSLPFEPGTGKKKK